jgi:phospholipid/cholesterol/gamma-HCH transport system substrate-binding protein
MEKSISRNIRLGLFVIIGTAFLIYSLYMIGNKRQLFGSSMKIIAIFHNINGLEAGNNVRFEGINVGTVESVTIINDTAVKVTMVIESDMKAFIRKDAIAGIGTDGLMGNKIVNINSVSSEMPIVKSYDTINGIRPIEMDEMLRTLNRTNNNIAAITDNLRTITDRVNSRNTLWSLLLDTIVAENVKEVIVNIRATSKNTAQISGNLDDIIQSVKAGKGSIGALITDSSFSGELHQAIVGIKLTGNRTATITGDMQKIMGTIDSGKGAVGRLLLDTGFISNLNKSMENIKQGSENANEVIDALKHSFLLRGYFNRKEKEKLKTTNQ